MGIQHTLTTGQIVTLSSSITPAIYHTHKSLISALTITHIHKNGEISTFANTADNRKMLEAHVKIWPGQKEIKKAAHKVNRTNAQNARNNKAAEAKLIEKFNGSSAGAAKLAAHQQQISILTTKINNGTHKASITKWNNKRDNLLNIGKYSLYKDLMAEITNWSNNKVVGQLGLEVDSLENNTLNTINLCKQFGKIAAGWEPNKAFAAIIKVVHPEHGVKTVGQAKDITLEGWDWNGSINTQLVSWCNDKI